VVASDGKGNRATSVIHFEIRPERTAAGRAALDAQFNSVGHYARNADAQLLHHFNAAALSRAPAGSAN